MSDPRPRDPRDDRPERLRRWAVGSFAAIAAALLLVAGLAFAALELDEAVRSFVKGESLWSKAQKEAVIALQEYVRTGDPSDWKRYREALRVPLGDRRARLALQSEPPELERAREGFLQGGLHRDEVDGMIRLYRWFGGWGPMERSIEHWAAGDSLIADLRERAARVRSEWASPPPDTAVLSRASRRIEALDRALTRRERRFTASIDRAADLARRWGQWGIGGLTLLLLAAIGGLAWRVYHLVRDREESLRRSEKRYRRLFENNVAGVFRSTPDGTLLECNPAVARMLGYDAPAELEGRNVRTVYPSDEERTGYLERLRERGRLVNEELRLERRDGSEIWVLENSVLAEDPETGRVVNEGTLVDITDRKEAERERRLLSTAVQTMKTGVLITGPRLEPPGPEILYVNEAMTEITGYRRDELVGETPRVLQGPETDPEVLDRLERRLSEGEPFRGETVNYRKDGSPYHLRWQITPLRDESGAVTHYVSVQEDVTAQRRAERRLQEREERFRQMAESVEEVFWLRSGDLEELLYVSPAFEEIWGRSVEELHDRPNLWLEAVHPEDRDRVAGAVFGDAEAGFDEEYRIVRPDGEIRWIQDQGVPVGGEGGETERIAGVARDITQQRRLEEQLRHRALHDPLTDLANRTLLRDRVERGLARARRSGETLGLLMLDVDHFKRINDRLGHAAGDRVLTELARRLEAATREEDTVARWGGDEFVLVLPEVGGAEGIEPVRDRIREAIRRPIQAAGESLQVAVTVGAVVHSDEGAALAVHTEDAEELIRYGDVALHRAKEQTAAGFHLFAGDEEMEGAAQIRLEQELRRAVDDRQLVPYYQPIVRLGDGALVGLEVLARWQHPERGIVRPGEFLPLAEELGLITPLGDTVARRALGEAASWPPGWGEEGERCYLSVNTSAQQFGDPDLAENLASWLEEAGFPPDRLVLEVTESSVMQATARVADLRKMGVRVHIDDFGTGYSTFTYLRDLEVDGLKIDRTFVANLPEQGADAALAETMVALGQRLDLTVVAEGIETGDQRRLLEAAGCPLGQGYLFGRPAPGETLAERFR